MNTKRMTIIGAALGLASFLAIGLLPALVYGGYAGVMLAGGILGTPIPANFLTSAFIVGGMVMGVTAVGSLFTVGGAVLGAAISSLVEATPAPVKSESKARN